MRDAPRHVVLWLLCACVLCAAPGCRVVRKWFSPAQEAALADPDPIERVQDATLSDPDARQGLEVRLLVVDDTNYDAPRVLNAFAQQSDSTDVIDPTLARIWSEWGFRFIPVPIERLDEALGKLTPVRPMSVQWLGEFGAWRPLVRTGNNNQTRVRVGESSRAIEPGRPRLIARSWSMPRLTERAVERVLRLDLGIQIESSNDKAFALLPDQRQRTIDDQGAVLNELLSTITLQPDHALVIVGEAPGTDWSQLPEPQPIAPPQPQNDDEQPIGPAPQDDRAPDAAAQKERVPFSTPRSAAIEPREPTLRSLGELMLVAPGSRLMQRGQTRETPMRVVIVLVPSVRGEFRLLAMPSHTGRGSL